MRRVLGFIHERALNLVHALNAAFCSLLYADTELTADTLLHCLGGPWRYFTRLDGGYYRVPRITLSGDYDIEVRFTRDGASVMSIFGEEGGLDNYLAFLSATTFGFKSGGNSRTIVWDVVDGASHLFYIKRRAGVVYIYGDGLLLDSFTRSGDLIIDLLGANNTPTNFYGGYLWDASVKDAGVLVRDYPINEDFSKTKVLVNNATTLNAELYTGSLTTDAGSSYVDGLLTLVQDGGNEYGEAAIALTAGVQHLLVYEVISETSVGSNLYIADSAGGNFQSIPVTVGHHEVLFTPNFSGALRLIIRLESAGAQVQLRMTSIKQAEGYGTYISHANDETLPYVELEAGVHTTSWWPNLALHSSTFTATAWSKFNSFVQAIGAQPDTGSKAYKLIATDTSPSGQLLQNLEGSVNTEYTTSVYLKAEGFSNAELHVNTRNGPTSVARVIASVDLTGGTASIASAGTNGFTGVSVTITPEAQGWYRVAMSGTTLALAIDTLRVQVNTPTGDGVSGVLVSSMQVELGSEATSYKETTNVAGKQLVEA